MKIRLIKAARVTHVAGEIVTVSPEQARFLLSIGAAEIVIEKETPEKPIKTVRKSK